MAFVHVSHGRWSLAPASLSCVSPRPRFTSRFMFSLKFFITATAIGPQFDANPGSCADGEPLKDSMPPAMSIVH
jgi:hypothetical protein